MQVVFNFLTTRYLIHGGALSSHCVIADSLDMVV